MRNLYLDSRRTGALLLIIICISVLLRLGSAFYHGNEVQPLPGVHDQISYQALAERVLSGHGFSFDRNWWPATPAGEPTAHWSFLYTLYLALVYSIFGIEPLYARTIQALIVGVLHPWLAWKIGQRLFGSAVGLIAASVTSVYAYFVFYAGALMTESFYILCILGGLYLLTRLGLGSEAAEAGSRWRNWLLLGLVLGFGTLFRQVLLITVPALLAWLWWIRSRPDRSPSGPSLFPRIAFTVLVMAAVILPWTARNFVAFDSFVLLNTNAGFAFYFSNHPIHQTSFMAILPKDQPTYQDLIPEDLRHLDEASVDRALLKEGVAFVLKDPIRYLRLSLDRSKDLFKFWPSEDSSFMSNVARVASFGICLPFMLLGIWLSLTARPDQDSTRFPDRKAQFARVLPLFLFVGIYCGVHLLSWSLIRYRLPVDSVLILFASVALARVLGMSRMGSEVEAPRAATRSIREYSTPPSSL